VRLLEHRPRPFDEGGRRRAARLATFTIGLSASLPWITTLAPRDFTKPRFLVAASFLVVGLMLPAVGVPRRADSPRLVLGLCLSGLATLSAASKIGSSLLWAAFAALRVEIPIPIPALLPECLISATLAFAYVGAVVAVHRLRVQAVHDEWIRASLVVGLLLVLDGLVARLALDANDSDVMRILAVCAVGAGAALFACSLVASRSMTRLLTRAYAGTHPSFAVTARAELAPPIARFVTTRAPSDAQLVFRGAVMGDGPLRSACGTVPIALVPRRRVDAVDPVHVTSAVAVLLIAVAAVALMVPPHDSWRAHSWSNPDSEVFLQESVDSLRSAELVYVPASPQQRIAPLAPYANSRSMRDTACLLDFGKMLTMSKRMTELGGYPPLRAKLDKRITLRTCPGEKGSLSVTPRRSRRERSPRAG